MTASFFKQVGISILTRYSQLKDTLTTALCARGGGILLLSWVCPSSYLDSLKVIQKEFCRNQFMCVFMHLCMSSNRSRPGFWSCQQGFGVVMVINYPAGFKWVLSQLLCQRLWVVMVVNCHIRQPIKNTALMEKVIRIL